MAMDIVWTAPPSVADATATKRFMDEHAITSYDQLVARSVADPDWFWDAVVAFLGIPFQQPYEAIRDDRDGPQFTTWFPGGAINISEACVDRWAADRPDQDALVAEHEDGSIDRYTFAELLDAVARPAGALRAAGVELGDRVAV